MSYGWEDDNVKQASLRKKRRSSASHGTVDLDRVETPTDEAAMDCAQTVAGYEPSAGFVTTDADSTRLVLDMLGILKQVRGEPDPDRYLAHCFVDRHSRTVAQAASSE